MRENKFLQAVKDDIFRNSKRENSTYNYIGNILIYVDASDCGGMDIRLLCLLCVVQVAVSMTS